MKKVIVEVKEKGEIVMIHYFNYSDIYSIPNKTIKRYVGKVVSDGKERVFKSDRDLEMFVSLSER